MNVLSLFDGISCGQLALKKAGINVSSYYASEIESSAITVTQHNFPNTKQIGDVMFVDFQKLNNIDLLIGGSPCNYWTIAKHNRETSCDGIGFELFSKYAEALETVKPKYFLYENNFNIHKDIKDKISELLGVEPVMINSSLLSAQNRKRLYWTNIPNISQPQDKKIDLSDIIGAECVCVAQQPYKRKKINGKYDRRYEPRKDNKSGTVVGTREGQLNLVMVKTEQNKSNCCISNGIFHGFGKEYEIDASDGFYELRSFTVEEREKLQTIPIGYTSCISDKYAKKAIGNGWTVDIIAHLLNGIIQ